MPIHNLGYRTWNGTLESSSTRWTVIAEIGIRKAWQSTWLRRMLYLAWMPGLLMGCLIFLLEQNTGGDEDMNDLSASLGSMLVLSSVQDPEVRQSLQILLSGSDLTNQNRHMLWSILILNLFRRSQPLVLIPLVGLIAPPLISQDLRSRAFLMYFSRPLSKMQYILGKAATLILYQSMITLMPAFTLFAVGVLLSPGINVLAETWDLMFRIVFVSAAIVIPTTFLSMMLSSLTSESRFAAFGWFSIWIFGYLAYAIMVPFSSPGDGELMHCVSLFHVFSDVAGWILDPNLAVAGIENRLIILGLITAISLAVIYRRVSAPMQI